MVNKTVFYEFTTYNFALSRRVLNHNRSPSDLEKFIHRIELFCYLCEGFNQNQILSEKILFGLSYLFPSSLRLKLCLKTKSNAIISSVSLSVLKAMQQRSHIDPTVVLNY